MQQHWITFHSLTHAQRAARALERKGITAVLARLPQGISPKGCGYAIIVHQRVRDAATILRDTHISFGMIFEKNSQGEFREVQI